VPPQKNPREGAMPQSLWRTSQWQRLYFRVGSADHSLARNIPNISSEVWKMHFWCNWQRRSTKVVDFVSNENRVRNFSSSIISEQESAISPDTLVYSFRRTRVKDIKVFFGPKQLLHPYSYKNFAAVPITLYLILAFFSP